MDVGRIARFRTSQAICGIGLAVLDTLGPLPSSAEAQDRRPQGRGAPPASVSERPHRDTRRDQGAELRLEIADEDLIPLQVMRGYAPPEFPPELDWHGWDQLGCESWHSLRDRVVILQSWSSTNRDSIEQVRSIHEMVSERFSYVDVQIIALHTPEGADSLEPVIPFALGEYGSVVVDHEGEYSDALGIYREPVNLVVDRAGRVSEVAQNLQGLERAVYALLDDDFEPGEFPDRFSPETAAFDVDFPRHVGTTGNTPDVRGKAAPPLDVTEWVNGEPDLDGKVVLVEFWRTNCPHCINAIPKLNEITVNFRDELVVIGLSNETPRALQQGLQQRNLSPSRFEYYIALDPRRRMTQSIGIRSVPHALIKCSQGIVRWQGHPNGLNDQVIQQIIDADRSVRMAGNRNRWTKG